MFLSELKGATATTCRVGEARSRGQNLMFSRRLKNEAIMSTLYRHPWGACGRDRADPSQVESDHCRISGAQQRPADREIALYLASHGDLFTDDEAGPAILRAPQHHAWSMRHW